MGLDFGKWLGHAAQAAGRAVGSGVSAVGKGIDKIPVIGKPLDSALDFSVEPLKVSAQIAQGKNVGKAALAGLKQSVNDTKSVAAVAPAVVSFVPGVGPVASAAISAGAAIAEGKPIDQVGEAAILGAIPGGTLAASAAKMGKDVLSGKVKDVGQAAADVANVAANAAGVQLPPGSTAVLAAGVDTTKALAKGEKPNATLIAKAVPALGSVVGPQVQSLVDTGQLEEAANKMLGTLPSQVKDAVAVGSALGHAQQLQSLTKSAIASTISKFATPAVVAAMTPAEQAIRAKLPPDEVRGFDIGINVKNCKCTQFEIAAVRDLLGNARQQDGYDAAVSLQIGQVFSKPPPAVQKTPELKAGYLIHQGIQHSDPQHVANVLTALPPAAQSGAAVSAKESTDSLGFLKSAGGAVAGGIVGLKVAGPIGAIVGAAVGRLVGKKLI